MRDVTEPSDADRVHLVLQLGWASAELRGRCRQVLFGLPQPATSRPTQKDFTLPLNNERSSGELVHQAEKEVLDVINKLKSLSSDLDVDFTMQELPYQSATATGHVLDALPKLCQPVHLAKVTAQADKDKDRVEGDKEAWRALSNFFYGWDTKIQDTLVTAFSIEASAYQLGRGLAESYWSLDPAIADEDARSWTSLFSSPRCETLKRFMVQLTPYFEPLTMPSTAASLDAWAAVAGTPERRRRDDAVDKLHGQTIVWRTLLIHRVSPHSFTDPRQVVHYAGRVGAVLKTFGLELVIGLGAATLALIAVVFLVGFKNSGVAVVLTALLGLFGITGAGLLAGVKATANASLLKLRTALDAGIIADAVTIQPPKNTEGQRTMMRRLSCKWRGSRR